MEVNRSAWRQWRTGALPEGAVFARASAAGGMTARGMRSCLALRVNHSLRLGAQARCRMTPLNAGLEPCPWRSQSSGAGSSSMSPACGTPLMRILAFRKSGPADLFQSPKSRMRTSLPKSSVKEVPNAPSSRRSWSVLSSGSPAGREKSGSVLCGEMSGITYVDVSVSHAFSFCIQSISRQE